jgi:carbonic anhydrase/acetyltransferase-like protein (isoleucine patch superfamily)
MPVYAFEDRNPVISGRAYVSPEATVVGDVSIGPGSFIGPGARIKGDYGTIVVGAETSIQENCVVHARPGERCEIGGRVNVGHGAIIHGGRIGDGAVIGMGAIVSDFAEVGAGAIVAEGCVVISRQKIPERAIAVGVPAKVVGEVTEDVRAAYEHFKDIYVGLSQRYKDGLRSIDKETE